MFLITGNKPGFDNFSKNPLSWMNDKTWNGICMLEDICESFLGIGQEIVKNSDE